MFNPTGRPTFVGSPGSPAGMSLPLRPGSAGIPGVLNFSNPGIMRKKKEFHLPMSPGQPRTPDAYVSIIYIILKCIRPLLLDSLFHRFCFKKFGK